MFVPIYLFCFGLLSSLKGYFNKFQNYSAIFRIQLFNSFSEIKNKYLLIGLSEVIIYSGHNRPIDFAYFNPMSTHLEIELNDRQNNIGTGNGNGVWQLSFSFAF